jgi:hypothetical protein
VFSFGASVSVEAAPPQTNISLPVQTAVWPFRGEGQPSPAEIAIQVSVAGEYRPPVPRECQPLSQVYPPQINISAPVQSEVQPQRPGGQPIPVDVGVQVSEDGAYRLPEMSELPSYPPQTTISVPVQTATGVVRPDGQEAPVEVVPHESDEGEYRPPSLR